MISMYSTLELFPGSTWEIRPEKMQRIAVEWRQNSSGKQHHTSLVSSWLHRWWMVQQFLWVLSAVFGRRLRNLRDAHVIIMAPVDGEARMVKSKSNPAGLTLYKFWAEEKWCVMRTVDIAQDLLTLHGYCTHFGLYQWSYHLDCCQRLKPNLTNITTQQVPRDVGKIHVSAMLQSKNQTTCTSTLTATTSRAYQWQTNSHDKDGNKRVKENANTYYHMNASCI